MIYPLTPVLPREQADLLREINYATIHGLHHTAAALLLIHDLRFRRPPSARVPGTATTLRDRGQFAAQGACPSGFRSQVSGLRPAA